MVDYSLESEIKAVRDSLNANLVRMPSVNIKMVRAAVNATKSEEKKRVYHSLKRGSGKIRKDITGGVARRGRNKGEGYIVVRNMYAANQVRGGEIIPKNRTYLSWEQDGKWIRASRVYIPPKWDFYGEVNSFIRSGVPQQKMEIVMGKELEKLWPS